MIVFCKNYGNLTGGTKTSTYIFNKVAKKVYALKSDIKNQSVKVGFVNLVIGIFSHSKFYGFDHYLLLPLLCGKDVVIYSHSNYHPNYKPESLKDFFLKKAYDYIYSRAQLVYCCSNFGAEYARTLTSNVALLYPVYNIDNSYHICNYKKLLGAKSKYLMVGHVDSRKYKYLAESIGFLNINIDIVGRSVDSNIYEKLKSSRMIKTFGFIENIPYKDYDALLLLSSSENVPAVIPEAISNGLVVITLNRGGVSELISKTTGIVFSENHMNKLLSGVLDFEFYFDNSHYNFLDCETQTNKALEILKNEDNFIQA